MLFESLVTLFITILIGAISIYLAFYFNKKPKLKYYQIEPGSIFSKSVNKIPNLKILYNDIEVNDEIILLRILIHNDGRTDIDKIMIHEPLSIQFKEPIELLDVTIEENEKISMQIINNGIYFKWDLLKKKNILSLRWY